MPFLLLYASKYSYLQQIQYDHMLKKNEVKVRSNLVKIPFLSSSSDDDEDELSRKLFTAFVTFPSKDSSFGF